jgi:anhydro-N-acetylmuramic acid kinase
MERLAAHCAPAPVASTQVLGIDPQAVEAAAFAWLAARRIDGLAGNLASVTGARGARVLGLLAEPRPRE